MENSTKKYSNGEVTILWKPEQCIHSGICFRGLGEVFDPKKRPWVTVENSSTSKIVEQVKKCPSGALSYSMNSTQTTKQMEETTTESEVSIETVPNGPLLVFGNLSVKDAKGVVVKKNTKASFCRCGASANKPFCDGAHKKNGFEG